MTTTMIVAIVLFAVTYVLLFALPKFKPYIALASAVVHMSLVDETILVIQATDVGPLCVSIKETTPEKLAWLTEKANIIENGNQGDNI